MSYNLLLVDDEVHAVEGVKADLDLKRLGIDRLFVAYNAKQAKEFFDRERIDIMLCDIEMPQGSGLDLLSWLRERKLSTEAIFLTSHADFKYAKEAMRLGSLDYLLKPILADDLEQVIRKAQQKIDRNSEIVKISQSHHLWMKHHSLIIERFWQDLINHTIPSTANAIQTQIEHHQLPITDDMVFLPVLVSVQRWNADLSLRDERILEYAIKNTAEELISGQDANGLFFYIDHGLLLGIMTTGTSLGIEHTQVEQACITYIETCNQYFYCDVSCYIGEAIQALQMADITEKLRQQDRKNVAFYNRVFFYDANKDSNLKFELPEIHFWQSLLKIGSKDTVIQEVEKLIDQLIEKQAIDLKVLNQLHQDLMQVLYSYLNNEGIQAHKLFGDEYSIELSEQASRSVRDLLDWVHHTVNKALKQAETVKESDSVVQIVQRYIAQNIDQDLSRESIAEMVYLNPDHLSRLFKKETGLSLSEYILTERIRIAKELLSQTDIPISSIASSVGHTNFSHFARIFRKHVGAGPSEYRQLLSRTD